MKSHLVCMGLAGLLLISGLSAVLLSGWYVLSVRNVNKITPELARVSMNQNAVRALLGETLEYSQRNPSIIPVLQSLNLLQRPGGQATPASASSSPSMAPVQPATR